MTQRILEPGEIEQFAGSEIPTLRPPERSTLFSGRAARLKQLAAGHSMGDYLEFIAKLAYAQQAAIDTQPPIFLPAQAHLATCKEHGMPALNVQTHHRAQIWCEILRGLLGRLLQEVEGPARNVIVQLGQRRDEFFEAQASKLLAGIHVGLDVAAAPLIGAALQVYWVQMAGMMHHDNFGGSESPGICPACGSRPVASIVRIGANEDGLRYLHCSVCSTEWHMVRIKCSNCEATGRIAYHGIEGALNAVQAEACCDCNTYLKICYMDRDAQVEPTADDLASTALDLLMSDINMLRSGQNLMLIHGDENG